ncbi:MAG: hypothetical protein HYW34_02345 [Candidatus Brennerbacteria bacterium]|nr:hypothetical protein [Candidatus Brennerbacteria bacterium]
MRRKKLVFLSVFCFFAIQVQGCIAISIKTNPYLTGLKQTENSFIKEKTLPEFFNIPRSLPDIKFNELIDQDRKFSTQKFSFKSWKNTEYPKNDTITGTLYLPKKSENRDLFIIIPGTAEDKSAAFVSEVLAGLGYRAIRIDSGFRPLPKKFIEVLAESTDTTSAFNNASDFMVNAMQQRIIDLMRLNDFWEISMNPTGLKVHVIGISLGGIIGSLLSVTDTRVQSLMMINSSAGIARILMDSKMSGFMPFRNSLMKKLGLSYQEAYLLIKEKLKEIEPITYASRFNGKKILIVSGGIDMISFIDTAIPYSSTKETWEAFGKQEWIIMPFAGHVSSFISLLPFWLEFPNPIDLIYTFIIDNSYAAHLIKNHFLPMALK